MSRECKDMSNGQRALLATASVVALGAVIYVIAAPEDQKSRSFYYSGKDKVYLKVTEHAVGKLKEGVAFKEVDEAKPEGPLGRLAPVLRRARMVVVDIEEKGALDKEQSRGEIYEYVLPVVSVSRDPEKLDRGADLKIFTPHIVAKFERDLNVTKYLEGKDLKVARKGRGGIYVLELAEGPVTHTRILEAANKLQEMGRRNKKVLFAHPDFRPVLRKGADPKLDDQWHLHNDGKWGTKDADIDAKEAWALTTGSGSDKIHIAILDDGVQTSHDDLKDSYAKKGKYYGPGGPSDDPSPKYGWDSHGTACAGIAVAAANDIGGRGGAHGCKFIAVHLWYGTESELAEAFEWAADPDDDPSTDDGAAVISCSWAQITPPEVVLEAIKNVGKTGRLGKGTVVLFAAMNENDDIADHQGYAAHPGVICVGATDSKDVRASYSDFGPELDVVAPGGGDTSKGLATTDLSEDQPKLEDATFAGYASGDFYNEFKGTSAATPLAASVCALMLSANEKLTAVQVRAILEHTVDPVPGPTATPAEYHPTTSHDVHYGYGRINAHRAVLRAELSAKEPDKVWPDHVAGLEIGRTESTNKLAWTNPVDNVKGVLIVHGSSPIKWKPSDGDEFAVGDEVVEGSVEVVGLVSGEEFTHDAKLPAYYAVFAVSPGAMYSWGATTAVEVSP